MNRKVLGYVQKLLPTIKEWTLYSYKSRETSAYFKSFFWLVLPSFNFISNWEMEMECIINCNQIDINLLRMFSTNYCPPKKCRVRKNLWLNISKVRIEKSINTFTLLMGVNQKVRLDWNESPCHTRMWNSYRWKLFILFSITLNEVSSKG